MVKIPEYELPDLSPAAAGAARPAEVELLLGCARTALDPAQAGRVRALHQGDLDWAYLTALAWRQGVGPLLYWNLNELCPEALPPAVLAEQRQQFLANARKNLFWTAELLKLLDLLQGHGIGAMPYKGPALIARLYGNLALRQISDLDILVRRPDVGRARELLLSQGYRQVSALDDGQDVTDLDTGYDYEFVRADGRVFLELHWAFAPQKFFFPLRLETVWQRAAPVAVAGTQLPGLCPEDMLLVLCVHLAAHCWRGTEGLKWVCDVAELLRVYPELDWDRLLAEANRVGSRRMLFLGLWLAHDLLGTPLPAAIRTYLQADGAAQALSHQVRRRLFAENDEPISSGERNAFYLQMRERAREKVQYVAHWGRHKARPNAHDRALLPLPDFLSFLYYALRSLRLAGKIALACLRRFLPRLPQA